MTRAVRPDAPDEPAASPLPPPPSSGGGGRFVDDVGVSLRIQPDSLIRVSVKEDPGLDGSYPVNEIGAVQLGYVGPVFVWNLTEKEAEQKIVEVLKTRDFRNATVSVRLLRASYDTVRVAGAVNRPGLIQIGAGDRISLNDALVRAGGLKSPAKTVKVRVVRDGIRSPVVFDLPGEEYALVNEEAHPIVPDVWLRNNDLAFVYGVVQQGTEAQPEVTTRILLLGEVKREGYYSFAAWEPSTMMNLMFKTGGLPPFANKRAVRIIRRDEAGMEEETVVNVEEIMVDGDPDKDVALRDGDRIVVPQRKITIF
jgi:protein involved in polysaccharide export with SLBB domain